MYRSYRHTGRRACSTFISGQNVQLKASLPSSRLEVGTGRARARKPGLNPYFLQPEPARAKILARLSGFLVKTRLNVEKKPGKRCFFLVEYHPLQ